MKEVDASISSTLPRISRNGRRLSSRGLPRRYARESALDALRAWLDARGLACPGYEDEFDETRAAAACGVVGPYSVHPGFYSDEGQPRAQWTAALYGLLLADVVLYLALAWYFSQVVPWSEFDGPRGKVLFSSSPAASRAVRRRRRLEPSVAGGVSDRGSSGGVSYRSWRIVRPATRRARRYGTPRKWYFPLDPRTYFASDEAVAEHRDGDDDDGAPPPEAYEPRRKDAALVVEVRGLSKTFGAHRAVAGVRFDMVESEVFCLLGHNGAGKTTTIAMLSGLVRPDPSTTPRAVVYGRDVADPSSLEDLRRVLGVCPQHDVLFEHLTVREHVEFFGRLKGRRADRAAADAAALLGVFRLGDRAEHLGGELSGGQKRKLSVAIAPGLRGKFVFAAERRKLSARRRPQGARRRARRRCSHRRCRGRPSSSCWTNRRRAWIPSRVGSSGRC